MPAKIISALLVLVGFANFSPVVGILSGGRLTSLYGVDFDENNLLILMKHRALLFGLIGGFIIYSAFRPSLQPIAFIGGFLSMLGFVAIALLSGGYNELLKKIVVADVVASALLTVAAVLFIVNRKASVRASKG